MKFSYLYDSDLNFISSFKLLYERELGKALICSSNKDSFLDSIKKKAPEALFLDIFPNDISLPELISAIRKQHTAQVPIYILSHFCHNTSFHTSVKQQVTGFVSKRLVLEHAAWFGFNSITDISKHASSKFLHLEDFRHSPSHASSGSKKKWPPGQIKLIANICMGKPNIDIARDMNISIRSVDKYICDIISDLGLRNKQELVHFAIENGICRLLCSNSLSGRCQMKSIFGVQKQPNACAEKA